MRWILIESGWYMIDATGIPTLKNTQEIEEHD